MRAIILHCWGGNSESNWFPWLKKELENKGFEVFCPDLPDSQNPKQDGWLNEAMKLEYDENTILIGHSLGSVLIMRLLEKVKVKAVYLVAGFDEHLGIPEIMNFFKEPFDYEKIKSNTDKIVMLSSDNDPYIPLEHAQELSKKLDCGLIIFEKMNHSWN